jgi:hypothetical protein
MSMLLYKAWLETRVRFLAGLIAVAIICIFYMEQHAGLVRMWTRDYQNHDFSHSIWAALGVPEYGWYLWHYLYDNYLQQIWALFATLLAFDGLIRERTSGTVLFSLGLPVSRKRWLFTRLAVVLIESAALSLFAVLVVIIGSSVIHQAFSFPQVFLHAALMVAAGVFLIAFGNLCYTLFPGNYLSLLFTLILLGVPYLWLQIHMQRTRVVQQLRIMHHLPIESRQTWLGYLDLAHAMVGPWQLNWATTPWISLLVIWMLTALVLGVTLAFGDRVDY